MIALTILTLASYAMWAAIRIENLKQDVRDLLDKPLSFWQQREMMRDMARRITLSKMSQIRSLPLGRGAVSFRRPPGFEEENKDHDT